MKYCKNCGNQLDDMAVICPKCGVQQEEIKTTEGESQNWWCLILGMISPPAGLILCCIWNSSKPNAAKKAGLGALIGIILYLLAAVVLMQWFKGQLAQLRA